MHKQIAENPVLAQLWSYWCGQRRDGAAPRRADVDLAELARRLPHARIVEREAAGGFRPRPAETLAARGFDADLSGKPLNAGLPVGHSDSVFRHYAMAWSTGRPICTRNKDFVSSAVERIVTRVILPLVDAGGRVVALVTAQAFECRMRSHAKHWLRWKLETQVEQIGFLDTSAAASAEEWRRAA